MRADSSLDEELLERRLHRGFGDIQLRADFLVVQSREYSFEHLPLALRQFIAVRLPSLSTALTSAWMHCRRSKFHRP